MEGTKKPKIVFFGTPEFAVKILEKLKNGNYDIYAIVTVPDKKRGRGTEKTPSPAKEYAEKNKIKILQPEKIKNNGGFLSEIKKIQPDVFVVASYGKIIPKELLDIPPKGTLNVHPSLLPRFRGPSPIQSAILCGENETGVTIMLLDEKIDEGPILAQKKLEFSISNFQFSKLENELAELGGRLLVETIPNWIAGKIKPIPQDHAKATYTKIVAKKDGEIDWREPPEIIERKIRALNPNPGTYAIKNDKRIIITEAEFNREKSALIIKRVKPEGKKEMDYGEYLKGNPPIF